MTDEQNIANRTPITISVMLAMLMNTIDSTIANVALPHIQGSLSASPDQIAWVLTSFIVASAMVTPVSGWLSTRFGARTVMMVAIVGFTASSMLCGVATSLPELVVFRALQGGFGAFTLPLSQAVLLDINPPSQHARAMALWAMGSILGPILGPIAGGYLTDQLSWRWCFFINLPVGALAALGVWTFMAPGDGSTARRFDVLGFSSLILAVACLQLMLDRGPGQDWFSSAEIWTEAVLAAGAFWVFLTHTLTTSHPFIDLAVLRDRNLIASCAFSFMASAVMFGAFAVIPIIMQSLMGYPVMTAGVVTVPRGLGMFVSMWASPLLARKLDLRLVLLLAVLGNAFAMWQMAHYDLTMSATPFLTSTFVQGAAQGLLFVPLTTLAFATVAPRLRAEGAALYSLVRSLGGSIGISMLQGGATANTQVMHEAMAAHISPSNPLVRWGLDRAFSPETTAGLLALDAEITRQAQMMAYVADFHVLLLVMLVCLPLILLMRTARPAPAAPPPAAD